MGEIDRSQGWNAKFMAMNVRSQDPPHYRGLISVVNNQIASSYLDRGSQRAISIPFFRFFSLILIFVFVYAAKETTFVSIEAGGEKKRRLNRLFVDGVFPFLRLRPGIGRYKSINFSIMFMKAVSHTKIYIEGDEQGSSFVICQICPVERRELLRDLKAIEQKLKTLERSKGSSTLEDFMIIDRSLAVIPKRQKTNEWRRLVVTLCCIFQYNHRKSHKLLKLWVDEETACARNDAVRDFNSSLLLITSPNALGRHGFNPAFTYIDLKVVESQLSQLISDIQRMDVQPFINSGTLLGYFRDGRPIPHDDDFDLGILLNGNSQDEVSQNWKKFRDEISQRWTVTEKGSFVAVKLAVGAQVDLFAAWILDDKVFVHPYCWADVERTALLPLDSITIRDVVFPVPADPDRILCVNYGPNWRVPDPFWRFDYRKSKRRFAKMLPKLKF